jgi:hypothetical protein
LKRALLEEEPSVRGAVSILPRLVLAGLFAFASTASLFGEEGSELSPRREWDILAKGRTEFDVSDLALVPSQLALAAEQSGCRYKESIGSEPIRFVSIEDRRLAIVYCVLGGASASHQIFDLSGRSRQRPVLVELPYLERAGGFGTTSWPGGIVFKRETGVFEAVRGSDISCGELRHTYRLSRESSTAFAVVRVEYRLECGGDEWLRLWDAPVWSFPAKAR